MVQHFYASDRKEWWEALSDLDVKTDASGNFTVRGFVDASHLRVLADHGKYIQNSARVSIGDQNVKVQLGRTIDLKGKLLFDPSIKASALRIRIYHANPTSARGNSDYGTFVSANGRFSFGNEAPGVVSLVVQTSFDDMELLRLDNVVIASDTDTLVLQDIDLRGMLHAIEVRVVDESGNNAEQSWLQGEGMDWQRGLRERSVTLLSKKPSFSFSVGAKGKRNVKLTNVQGDQTVVLRDGLPAQIVIDNIAALPEDWKFFGHILHLDENDSLDGGKWGYLIFDEQGKADTVFPWSGRLRVRLIAQHQPSTPGGGWSTELDGDNGAPLIEVLETDGQQVIHISFDPEALEAAMQITLQSEQENK